MASGIKIRAKEAGGVTTIKSLMSHPMETGGRKDKKTGQAIPAHFIQEVTVTLNDKEVVKGYWSVGVSKNPYLSVKVKGGKKGDTVAISWADNKGESDSVETRVS
jgi:sulfur-oxidizing protein SoxZ